MAILTGLHLLTGIALLTPPVQESGSRASDLVKILTDQDANCVMSTHSPPRERRIAIELLSLGTSALPAMEQRLDLLEAQGISKYLCGLEWLLYVYAQLRHEDAYPRLKRMLTNPKLSITHQEIQSGMAASLDLTSVVSTLDRPGKIRPSLMRLWALGSHENLRGELPQNQLNEFIVGWLKADRQAMERPLSRTAKDSLNRLVQARTWNALRRGLAIDKAQVPVEIGYKLDLPEGMVEPPGKDLHFRREAFTKRIAGRVEFYAGGKSCGRSAVEFLDTHPDFNLYEWHYVIDNADVTSLIAALRRCSR
jgi:hypothetical protein